MSDAPANHDDVALSDEPVDPRQWAMHGLLCIHYENAVDRASHRVSNILSRAAKHGFVRATPSASLPATKGPVQGPVHRRFSTPVLRRWVIGLGGLAAAACLIIGVATILNRATPAAADQATLRAAALQVIFLPTSVDPFMDENPQALQIRLAEIEGFRRQRDAALARSREETDPEKRSILAHVAMEPWAQTYRGLRNLGRFEEARQEILAASTFVRSPGLGSRFNFWRHITTADRGFLELTLGNYSAAREAFLDSINGRVLSFGAHGDPSLYEPASQGHLVTTLPPMHWALSLICIAEGKVPEARQWRDRADRVLADFFRAVCRKNGIVVSDDAAALAVYDLAPPEFRNPKEAYELPDVLDARKKYNGFCPDTSFVTFLRVHEYHEARLRLYENDLEGARRTLARGLALPYAAFHDEYRLPFAEPVLAARIAIVAGQYDQALAELSNAEANVSALDTFDPGGNLVHKPPVPSTRLAELRLLRGVALLGKDENSPEGHALVEKALAVPAKLAAGLSAEQQSVFTRQFDAWRAVAAETREKKP